MLSEYLSNRPEGEPIWPGTWAKYRTGATMLRKDLDACGIPYQVDGPNGPLFAHFHALRHSHITALGRNGVDLRTAQELAGHSSTVLTARYMYVRLHDLAGAVNRLPDVTVNSEVLVPGEVAATETGDSTANSPPISLQSP